jgi:hypothetical protein
MLYRASLAGIKNKWRCGNACYHENPLSSCLLSKNIKIRIYVYNTINLPVVLYGCGSSFLTLKEEHRLRVFENRVLRRTFGPKGNEKTGGRRKLYDKDLPD